MAKSNSPKIKLTPEKISSLNNPKLVKEAIHTEVNANAIIELINQINQKLEHRSGFYFYNIRPIGGILRAKFYLEKTTFLSQIFVSGDGVIPVIGIWIWLIREASAYKLIISRAKNTTIENQIPEPNWAFQILGDSGENLSENRIESVDFDWKKLKINEDLYGGVKGFFVGKGALNTFCFNTSDVDGLQIELWQMADNSPILYFSKVSDSKRRIETFGSTSIVRVLTTDDGEGMSGSRPCPPYSN